MSDIEKLIPQRYPFLFIDDIISADRDEIVGIKMYDKSFIFSQACAQESGIIPGVILIESMVQCGGAGIAKVGLLDKKLWGLASLENVRFFGVVKAASEVRMVVKNLKITNKVLKQSGTAFVDGKIVLKASWVCLEFKQV